MDHLQCEKIRKVRSFGQVAPAILVCVLKLSCAWLCKSVGHLQGERLWPKEQKEKEFKTEKIGHRDQLLD